MTGRIAVFLCKCGGNISDVVDFEALARELAGAPWVVAVEEHNLLCSPDGKAFMTEAMRRTGATHAVAAACSPKDHEADFRRVLEEAGVNPFLLQMANIREQCAWITKDHRRALEKARAMTMAAVKRVALHQALEQVEIECNPDLLVVGGGIAGIEAALTAARAGRRVTLVERAFSLGGRVPEYEEVAPNMECGPCLIAPRLSEISEQPGVRILTGAEVTSVRGFHGSFEATIVVRARQVDAESCIGCGECAAACPVDTPNEFNRGMDARKAISIPFPGAVPNCSVVDAAACLRGRGEDCAACAAACPVGALDFSQEDRTVVVESGAVILATGFDDAGAGGLGGMDDVITLREYERMCSGTGPTQGRLLKKDGTAPARIAVVHCASREELGVCGGFCCTAALMVAPLARMSGAECEVVHVCSDLVVPGSAGAGLLAAAESKGARFVRLEGHAGIRVEAAEGGGRRVVGDGGRREVLADMVVLVDGARAGTGARLVATDLFLESGPGGFLKPDHPILRPVGATVDGVYLAGGVLGPRGIAQAVAEAHAAAGQAIAAVQPGKRMKIEVITASTDDAACCGCLICMSACPFGATVMDAETGLVGVNAVLCRGCGTCVAACPTGAATARHFSREQIAAEMEEVLNG